MGGSNTSLKQNTLGRIKAILIRRRALRDRLQEEASTPSSLSFEPKSSSWARLQSKSTRSSSSSTSLTSRKAMSDAISCAASFFRQSQSCAVRSCFLMCKSSPWEPLGDGAVASLSRADNFTFFGAGGGEASLDFVDSLVLKRISRGLGKRAISSLSLCLVARRVMCGDSDVGTMPASAEQRSLLQTHLTNEQANLISAVHLTLNSLHLLGTRIQYTLPPCPQYSLRSTAEQVQPAGETLLKNCSYCVKGRRSSDGCNN